MAQKVMNIRIKDKYGHPWEFNFDGDTKYWDDWKLAGFDVCIVENIIPIWIVDLGLTKVWCFIQDALNFNLKLSNYFGKKKGK